MKAVKFIQKFGWDGIQGVITNADSITTHVKVYEHDTILIDYIHWDGLRISIKENGEWIRLSRKYQNVPDFICINELKQLIEAKELVDSFGGLEEANKIICNAYHGSNHPIPDGHEELSVAIQLVETIENVSLVESVNDLH